MTTPEPPSRVVHPTHRPEPEGERLVAGCTSCTVCCRVVSGDRTGPTPRGRAECGGNPGLSLRDDAHEQRN